MEVFQVKGQATPLEKHMAMYHDVTRYQDTVFYNALITREDRYVGRTVCACVEFRSSKLGASLFGFSGSWGINPGKHSKRSVSGEYKVQFPELLKAADQIYILAGRCPTDKAFKAAIHIAGKAAEAGVKAYLVSQGVPPNVVDEIAASEK